MHQRNNLLLVAVVLLIGLIDLFTASLLAAPAGSESDPLVTRDYLQFYLAEQLSPLTQNIEELQAQLTDLEQRVNVLKARLSLRITLTIGKNVAFVGDQPRTLDAPPYLSGSGRTMLPFRFLGEALGAIVEWESGSRSVIFRSGGRTVTLQIGKATAFADGQEVQLDAPPQLVNNRTMVPLRAVSELLGARVDWDNATRTVSVYP